MPKTTLAGAMLDTSFAWFRSSIASSNFAKASSRPFCCCGFGAIVGIRGNCKETACGKTRILIRTGGHFDIARPSCQAGPASDEWDHFQHGLVDGFNPKLPHDRPINVGLPLFTPKRFVEFMNSSLSPNLIRLAGIYVHRTAKATAFDRIKSRALTSPASNAAFGRCRRFARQAVEEIKGDFFVDLRHQGVYFCPRVPTSRRHVWLQRILR